MRLVTVITALWVAQGAQALDLRLPSTAQPTAETVTEPDSYALPTGPFADGTLPSLTLEGRVARRAWRVDGAGLTTLQILAPIREQLAQAGYVPLFECDAPACGGFDFRFATEVLPAPAMMVGLSDFRFLAARKSDADQIGLLVSRTRAAGYIQMIRVTTGDDPAPAVTVSLTAPNPATAPLVTGDIAQRLLAQGHVVLTDLDFATGSSDLGPGPYASLTELAAFMAANNEIRIAVVGHTDTVGGLDGNIALSKRRAGSVVERLATVHNVARNRMEAEGMGYLAPIAPNNSPEGREANRRVEVILLSSE